MTRTFDNEKYNEAWAMMAELQKPDSPPVGPERNAAVDVWHAKMREGDKLFNIEAERRRQLDGQHQTGKDWSGKTSRKPAGDPAPIIDRDPEM